MSTSRVSGLFADNNNSRIAIISGGGNQRIDASVCRRTDPRTHDGDDDRLGDVSDDGKQCPELGSCAVVSTCRPMQFTYSYSNLT